MRAVKAITVAEDSSSMLESLQVNGTIAGNGRWTLPSGLKNVAACCMLCARRLKEAVAYCAELDQNSHACKHAVRRLFPSPIEEQHGSFRLPKCPFWLFVAQLVLTPPTHPQFTAPEGPQTYFAKLARTVALSTHQRRNNRNRAAAGGVHGHDASVLRQCRCEPVGLISPSQCHLRIDLLTQVPIWVALILPLQQMLQPGFRQVYIWPMQAVLAAWHLSVKIA